MSFHQGTAKSLSSTPVAKGHESLELGDAIPAGEQQDEGNTSVWQGILFLVAGSAQLFYWNALLNMVGDINAEFYKDHANLSDTLTAVYNTLNLLTAILVTWRGSLNIPLNIASGFALALTHIITGVCVQSVSGTGGVVFLHILCAVAGAAGGFFQACQYALAGSMPKPMSGWVSVGNGVSGLLTFGLWMLFSEAALKGRILACLWWTMGIGALLLVFSNYCMWRLARRPEVAANMANTREKIALLKNDPSTPSYWDVFKMTAPMTLSIFFVFFVTLFLYPNIGPFRWNYDGNTEANVLMGMYQIGDFVGRSLPLFAGWLSWLILSPKILYTVVVGRLLLMLLFVLMWQQSDVSFWGNYGWQIFMMLCLSITNGWFGTCGMIRGPGRVPNEEHRARGAAICLVGLLTGIVAGLWIAKLATLGS